MSTLARLRSWARAAFRRPDLNAEIEEELRFHVAQAAKDLEHQGLGAAEAARQARAALGGFDGHREACRQALGLRLIDEIRGDLRYSTRALRRSPMFTAVVTMSFALAIGVNTAIFSLVDAVLLKALPVAHPEQLVFVDNSGGKSEGSNAPPYPCFEIFRDRNTHFAGLAMFSAERFRVTTDGSEELVRGQYASGNYFEILGIPALYGRVLTMADDPRGGVGGPDGPVVVISHGFWQRRFAMSPSVIGTRIQVGTKTMTIVGVTPPGFAGVTVGSPVDLTVPVTLSDANLSEPRSWWFSVVGRLNDDASVEAARAELDGFFQSYMTGINGRPPGTEDYFNRIELVRASRGLHDIRRQFVTPLGIVMAIAGFVLAIGCANVASLLLARASTRQHEMALRLAIGAGRVRIIRQLLTEGTLLAALGAGAGLLLAHWSVIALVAMIGATRRQIVIEPQFDARVFGFTAAVAILAGLVSSLVPALRSARVAPVGAGSRASTATRHRRIGQALVTAQVTLSLVLLCAAALFVRTLRNLEHVDAGFRTDGVMTIPVEAVIARDAPPGADPQVEKARIGRLWEDLAVRAGALPGVRSAAAATLVPMSGRDRGVNIRIVGEPPPPEQRRHVRLNHVTTGYFEALGLRLLAGQGFAAADGDAPVAVLGQTAARELFGDASPVGRSVSFNAQSTEYRVIGVVEDTQYESLRAEPARLVYVPMRRPLDVLRGATLTLKTSAETGALARLVRDEVKRTIPGGFSTTASTLAQQVEDSLLQERLISMLAALFGGLALLLASIGLYGLLAHSVVNRTLEFGIRMAIGARTGTVMWLVLRETIALVGAGLVGGLLAVFGLGRYVRSILFDVTPADPIAIGSAVIVLLAVALVAASVPAWRASRIDPARALHR